MLKTLLPILAILFSLNLVAQNGTDGYTYSLKVTTTKRTPDVGRDVVFVEKSTYERIALKTDNQGSLTHTFTYGNWLGSIGEMRNCIKIDATYNGNGSQSFTYNPENYELQNKIVPDRRSVNFTRVNQGRLSPTEQPTAKESIITIKLLDQKRKVYPGVDVALVNFDSGIIYESRTNSSGAAMFKVPVGQEFDVDVDGVESLRRIRVAQVPMNSQLTLLYQPREFKENQEDRFIVQSVTPEMQPSSSHAKVKIKVRGGSKGGINEDVYVRMLKSNAVYKAKTNDQGEVLMMLPIRQKYFIDFTYQRGADQIDLSDVKGIAQQTVSVLYTPDPRMQNIENFIPRLESLIDYDVQNFIDKQYPEPTNDNIDFYLNWGNKFNKKSKEALLEIGLKVKSKMDRKVKTPLNIALVIDKSGSMMGEDRIDQLKKSLIAFIQQLNHDDIVSVVVFNSQATVAIPAQPLGDKKKFIDIIHAIQADGGTVIYDGLEKGFQEVAKNKSKGYVDRVLLLSDGYGSREVEEVISMAKGHIKNGTELSTIGVGTNYNQALLSQLASAGGGMLHFAGTSANIHEAFQAELQSILYPFAEKAVLEVRYNDQIVYRQLYGYTNEEVSSGKMKVDIPHLFPGLNQMALAKFDLINPTPKIVNEKVVVTLSYLDPVSGKMVKKEKSIQPEWTDATGELDMTIEKEHKKVLAVAVANQSLKVMSEAFHSGDRTKAEQVMNDAIKQINQLLPNAKSEDILILIDRLEGYADAFERLRLGRTY